MTPFYITDRQSTFKVFLKDPYVRRYCILGVEGKDIDSVSSVEVYSKILGTYLVSCYHTVKNASREKEFIMLVMFYAYCDYPREV